MPFPFFLFFYFFCHFLSTHWVNEATPNPWKQTPILPVHCGISPLHSMNYTPGRPEGTGKISQKWSPKSKGPHLEFAYWQPGKQYHFGLLYSSFCIKRFEKKANLLPICSLTQYMTCQWYLLRRKQVMAKYKISSICIYLSTLVCNKPFGRTGSCRTNKFLLTTLRILHLLYNHVDIKCF